LRLTPSPTAVALALGLAACAPHAEAVGRVEPIERVEGVPSSEAAIEIERVARTPHLATYPCGAQCHDDRTPDPTPRPLVMFHVGRTVAHGPALDFCNDCHDLDDVDQLVLLDGTTRVGFDASDALCAQCHGGIHDDWEAGVHGLSTGGWRGTIERRLCTACHDPHAPDRLHFEALPVPADVRLHEHAGRAQARHEETETPPASTAGASQEGP
jgi:hypothetical protein